MKNIAILQCEKAGNTCTAAGCFRCFNEKSKAFERYQGQDVQMMGFFQCNGCDADQLTDERFAKKLNRMKEHDCTVHLAFCVMQDCEKKEILKQALNNAGLEWVEGTH